MAALRWAGSVMMNPDARCGVCDCSEECACEGGCAWADEAATICTRCSFLRPGQPVWYYPNTTSSRRAFAAIIASEPRRLGDDLVVRLEGLGPEYGEAYHGGRELTTIAAASRLALRPRELLHEQVRQLLHWSAEIEAELELDGKARGATREQLRSAIRALDPVIIPTREDCSGQGGAP